jgi:hypothetical protein
MIITIIDGKYPTTEEVKVREEISKENVISYEYSEKDCLNTIDVLNARKTAIVAEIDAEIAINQARINEIKKLDRASNVEAVIK